MPTAHVRAVYSPKPPITGKKLVEAAAAHDLTLRLLLIGGGIPSDPAALLKNLKSANAGALLIAGAGLNDRDALKTLDRFIRDNDRKSMAGLLNAFQLPWIELYSSDFQYEKHLKLFPRDQENLDKAVSAEQQPFLKLARSRYIVNNESQSKTCRELMAKLSQVIAEATDGIVADHRTPKR